MNIACGVKGREGKLMDEIEVEREREREYLIVRRQMVFMTWGVMGNVKMGISANRKGKIKLDGQREDN